jgi:hypothetical protein
LYVMQFDIIVKDSIAAPQTGWVFATLVYDGNAPGDTWDKIVPLGAMWGNDPGLAAERCPADNLQENWINPAAPNLFRTDAWLGRTALRPQDIEVEGKVLIDHHDSSFMSCHGPAEWQPALHKQLSFLLPSYPNSFPNPPFKPCPVGDPNGPHFCSPAPASPEWSRWFQSPRNRAAIPQHRVGSNRLRHGLCPQDAAHVLENDGAQRHAHAVRHTYAASRHRACGEG